MTARRGNNDEYSRNGGWVGWQIEVGGHEVTKETKAKLSTSKAALQKELHLLEDNVLFSDEVMEILQCSLQWVHC